MTRLQEAQNLTEEMLKDLETLVNLDSPSRNKELTDKAMQFLIDRFQAMIGGKVTKIEQDGFGDHVKLEVGEGDKQILLLGHVDTVWSSDETKKRPFSKDSERAYGPGIFDMKCGLIQGLYAMSLAIKDGIIGKKIVFLINTDEEVGSPTSRKWIEEEAKKSEAVFVLEPSLGLQGALKTQRKGVARFTLKVYGVPAHSGIDHEKGCSAIEELAHQILCLQGLTNYETGSTVNVGLVSGGQGVNVVADRAEAKIDLRIWTKEEADRLIPVIRNLSPKLGQARLEVQGELIRPPMEKKTSRELYSRAVTIADHMGIAISEGSTGGASDGCFTAFFGIPTLDGLGAVGEGAHAYHESIKIKDIPERCALLAQLITSV